MQEILKERGKKKERKKEILEFITFPKMEIILLLISNRDY